MDNIQRDVLDKITLEAKEAMMRIHFTSDLHHGHPKIINICDRPTTLENHDEWLVKEVFNAHVGRKDTVYILGDLSMAKRIDAEKFIDRLNGEKHLILGNHDKNIKNSTRFASISQIKQFNFSQFGLNIHIELCHYPMASWNRRKHGSWHLYGHLHGRFANAGLSFDVGIDNRNVYGKLTGPKYSNWCKPINLYDVCQIMAIKQDISRGSEPDPDTLGLD